MRFRDLIEARGRLPRKMIPEGSKRFNPKITGDFSNAEYRDGYIHADVSPSEHGIQILTISSHYPGNGYAKRAIQWMKKRYKVVTVNDPGDPKKNPNSFAFWKKMIEAGLIDEMYDEDGNIIFSNGQWRQIKEANEFFTRFGTPVAPDKVHVSDKGKPYTVVREPCVRCGGAGKSDKWIRTGLVCYRCNGSGKEQPKSIPVYTQEKLAKLNISKGNRDAKKLAAQQVIQQQKQAEADARRQQFETQHADLLAQMQKYAEKNPFIKDVLGRARQNSFLRDNQIRAIRTRIARIEAEEARRGKASFVGEIGKPIQVSATVKYHQYYEPQQYGWAGYNFRVLQDEVGNTIIYKGSTYLGKKGDRVKFLATVKSHEQSKKTGEPQTLVARPRKIELTEIPTNESRITETVLIYEINAEM